MNSPTRLTTSQRKRTTDSAFGRWRTLWVLALGLSLWASISPPLRALQKEIKSKPRNYRNAQVIIKESTVKLVEVFSTPTQMVFPGSTGMKAKPSMIQYANRAGQLPSAFLLTGKVLCKNKARQAVEAVGLTVVLLDAFHQAVQIGGQNASLLYKLSTHISPSMEGELTWEKQVDTLDVFEIAVIVTRARFSDGSVWMAPEEELVDVF